MGSTGASKARAFERQLSNYLNTHNGNLPRQIIAVTDEQRNIVFEAVNKLYTPTELEQKVMTYAYIEDGRLKLPYGGLGFKTDNLSQSAIEGLKKWQAVSLAKNIYDPVNNRDGAIPSIEYWRRNT